MKIKYEVISSLIYGFFRLDELTGRFEYYNYQPEITPAIYAIWHSQQCWLGFIQDRKKLNILISLSRDGEIIAYTVKKLGFSTIRGSVKRGGMRAGREILRVLEQGENIAYTVDGPRGPGFVVKEGIIRIAQMSQKPIIPLCGDASFRVDFNSWDKYRLPLPFSRFAGVFGEPIHVPEGEEYVEEYRLKLEKELLQLKNDAESKIRCRT